MKRSVHKSGERIGNAIHLIIFPVLPVGAAQSRNTCLARPSIEPNNLDPLPDIDTRSSDCSCANSWLYKSIGPQCSMAEAMDT